MCTICLNRIESARRSIEVETANKMARQASTSLVYRSLTNLADMHIQELKEWLKRLEDAAANCRQ
jgi:hypothetical protein